MRLGWFVALGSSLCTLGCGGAGTSSADLAAPPDLTPTVALTGIVDDWLSRAPIAGMQVCVDGTSLCVASSAQGDYRLPAIPANANVAITYSARDYRTNYTLLATGADDVVSLRYFETVEADAALGQAVGVAIDASKPVLLVGVGNGAGGAATGATASLDAAAGCTGPFYFGAGGLPDRNQTSVANLPFVFWVNCTAGDYQLTVSDGAKTCTPHDAWPGQGGATLSVRLTGSDETFTAATCQ